MKAGSKDKFSRKLQIQINVEKVKSTKSPLSETELPPVGNISISDKNHKPGVDVHSAYEYGPAQILPNLYLGSEQNASNEDVLINLGVSHILNVAQEVINPLAESHCITLSTRLLLNSFFFYSFRIPKNVISCF